LIDLAGSLNETGDYPATFRRLGEAIEIAAAAGDPGTEAAARLDLAFYRLSSHGESQHGFMAEAERALQTFTELGDEKRLARASFQHGVALFWVGRSEAAEGPLDRSIDSALAAGDRRQAEEAMGWHNVLLMFGHSRVEEGGRRIAELLSGAKGKYAEAFLTLAMANVEAANGSFDEARALLARSEAIQEDVGMAVHLAAAHAFAEIERHAGNWEVMAERLTAGVQALERMGERGFLSTTSGYLAEALYRLGRYDEAERYVEKTRAAAAPDDFSPQVQWRCVLGKILARRGDLEEAERLVREAIDIVEATDYHPLRGDAQLDLAEVLQLAGRIEEAAAAARGAEERYVLKGDAVLTERARQFAQRVGT
jgi:tetratricopeptide (TPR) repeat protein